MHEQRVVISEVSLYPKYSLYCMISHYLDLMTVVGLQPNTASIENKDIAIVMEKSSG